jgi:glycosyltransferase involved in cell wall biosynthesis
MRGNIWSVLVMLSVIIATHDSERPLVQTLVALVPGATAGLVRDVIVADGGSRDETQQVADVAGCVFLSSGQSLGARFNAAAERARGGWLMFMAAGAVPAPTWIEETAAFAQGGGQAAVFSAQPAGLAGWMRRLVNPLPANEQGLLIRKAFYAEVGRHRADAADPERDLLRRIKRSRLTVLRTPVSRPDI